MRLTCPDCNKKGQLIDVGDDVVWYCPVCGQFKDIRFVTIWDYEKGPRRESRGEWFKSPGGLKIVRDMIDEGGSISSVCSAFHISRPTLYRYAEQCDELAEILGIKKGAQA